MLRVTNARSLLGALMVASAWLHACGGPEFSSDLFEDYPEGGAPSDGGGTSSDGGVAGSASISGSGGESGAPEGTSGQGGSDEQPPFTCFPLEVDDATSLFVTLAGEDSATCGSRSFPCRTIKRAIERAALGSEIDHVYVATGTYAESLELRPGITVEGGVSVFGSTGDFEWTLACSHEDKVVVAGAEGADQTVLAEDLSGEARLTNLTIETPASEVAESSYGVKALGASTKLVLTNVEVLPGSGGDGADGGEGDAGDAGAAACEAGDAEGGSPGDGALGPPDGEFDPELGFVPADGEDGEPGGPGHSGVEAAAPSPENGACVACYTCTNLAVCVQGTATPSCGERGTSGCGGDGGGAGEKGGGGGSSVAIFAVDSLVEVRGGALVSGDGGKGGKGGPGGEAGPGGAGETGDPGPTCRVTPCEPLLCSNEGGDGKGPGTAGTQGGRGGDGGFGSGGSGGHSFAIVELGDAEVKLFQSPRVDHGTPGRGGCPVGEPSDSPGCGADGLSGERY